MIHLRGFMNKKIIISIIILAFFPSFLFCQKISLKNAIDITLEKNEKIFQYKEKLAQKEFEEKGSLGNFLPTINLTASYTHLNESMDINLNAIRDAMITIQSGNSADLANISSILSGTGALTNNQKLQVKSLAASTLDGLLPQFVQTFKKQDFKTATLQAIQPLFVGGKLIAAKKYASAEKEAASLELTKIKNEAVTETIDNYVRVLLLKEVVRVRKDVLNGIIEHQKRAQKLFDEGVIPNYHILRANVAVADAEKNLSDDQSNYQLALLALKNSMGLEGNDNIEVTDSITFNPVTATLEGSVSSAMNNQPLLQLIAQKKISAEQNYNVSISNFLPTIAAFGKYEMYPEYLSSLEPRWAVGVQMNLNIFNGFKDHLNVQTAKHLKNEVMYVEADAKKKIELWVNKSFKEIEKSRTKYEKLNATVALAKENVRQNIKRFETGMGISLEVIDAHLTYEKVELDRFLSLFEYYRAVADLNLATGDPSSILKIWNN
jgi:outer membrane protein TolC